MSFGHKAPCVCFLEFFLFDLSEPNFSPNLWTFFQLFNAANWCKELTIFTWINYFSIPSISFSDISLVAYAKLAQKGKCWIWNQRSRGSVLTGFFFVCTYSFSAKFELQGIVYFIFLLISKEILANEWLKINHTRLVVKPLMSILVLLPISSILWQSRSLQSRWLESRL